MKIKYIKGDLFTTEIITIMHGVFAQGVMGSGVAKIIRERYPKAYERYMSQGRDFGLQLGELIVVPCGDRLHDPANFKIIVNAITQERYGNDGRRYVSYDAVSEAMKRVNSMAEIYGVKEVAMPQIGAGLGGGDWQVISAIIESELKAVQPVVYIL